MGQKTFTVVCIIKADFRLKVSFWYYTHISLYSFLPWVVSAICCNYLTFLQFTNSKKNSFLENYSRKYGIQNYVHYSHLHGCLRAKYIHNDMHTTVFNLMGQITPIMEFKIQIHKKKKKCCKNWFWDSLG